MQGRGASWAERGARLGWQLARKKKASGPKELGQWAEIKKGGKNEFAFFFFQIDFQKHFQIGFEFI